MNTLKGIPSISGLSITPLFIWVAFGIVVLLWIIATLVLQHHWKEFEQDDARALKMTRLYMTGSIFLLLLAFFGVLSFSL